MIAVFNSPGPLGPLGPLSLWLRRCLLVALSLLTASAAWARNDDDGAWQIVHARYGTGERNIDVTGRLKELARADRRFKLTNELFRQDPAVGQRKTLRIFAKGRNGDVRTFDYREGDWVDGNNFTGWGGGNWGDNNWNGGWEGPRPGHANNNDRDDDGNWAILQARYGTPDRNIDVTGRLKELARADRRFKLANQLFREDPAVGQRKTLRIIAKGRNGEVRNFDYREGDWVDGGDFTGWGRGSWGDSNWNGGWDGRPGAGHQPPPPPPPADNRLTIVRATYGAGSRQADVTARVRNVSRGNALIIPVDNKLVDRDPAVGDRKTLRVYYLFGRGPERVAEAREGEILRVTP
ncbi:hypothetical protein SAMN05216359_101735 [Roseateles sp. YR242]|uniref:hypothetical protein n=1 Tax=Roseateles sp. YR242 TaxID=1855305 RepID=UPI0008B89BCD|nr:hypothetical protein [Roseateles sp. YR242]SEK41129.1 hypothetical protein SAMN05216359_101735 [Roseateles sp. YR242]